MQKIKKGSKKNEKDNDNIISPYGFRNVECS